MNLNQLNYRLRIALVCGYVISTIIVFTFVVTSLLGMLITLAIGGVYWRWHRLQRRDESAALNMAMRAVCDRDESILGLLGAASSDGRVGSNCYDFAIRLEKGQPPIEAAAESRMTLEISTAIAMIAAKAAASNDLESSSDDHSAHPPRGSLPQELLWEIPAIRGQQLYLTITLIACLIVAVSGSIYLAPQFEQMFDEFGLRPIYDFSERHKLFAVMVFASGIAIWFLIPVALKLMHWIGLQNRYSFGHATDRADILLGIAEAIRRRIPVADALEAGGQVAQRSSVRREVMRATAIVHRGGRPAEAFHKVNWINSSQRDRLAVSSASRAADLLEQFAAEAIRDTTYQVRWVMAFLHPLFLLLIGMVILMVGILMHGSLAHMIRILTR